MNRKNLEEMNIMELCEEFCRGYDKLDQIEQARSEEYLRTLIAYKINPEAKAS